MIDLDNVCKPIKCCVCVHQERCSDNTTSLTFELACPKEIKIRLDADYYTEHQRAVMLDILAQYTLGNIVEKEKEKETIEPRPRKFEDVYKESKTYEHGLEEAWEIARKIAIPNELGGFNKDELEKIFGEEMVIPAYLMMNYPDIYEVKAKIDAWEAEQAKPKFGDVVEITKLSTGQKRTGIYVEENSLEYVVIDTYLAKVFPKKSMFTIKKTGKHIDIQSLLEG